MEIKVKNTFRQSWTSWPSSYSFFYIWQWLWMRPFAIRTLYQQVKFDVPRHLPQAIFSSIALSYHSVSCLIKISQIQSKIPGTHRLPPGKGTVCVYPVGPILTEYLTKRFSLNFISSLTFIFVKGWWRMQRSPLVCIICTSLKCSREQSNLTPS